MKLLKYFLILFLAAGIGFYYLSCQENSLPDKPTPPSKVVVPTAAYMRIEAAVVKMPAGPNTAAYMKVTNTGREDDKLLSVACTFAGRVELHDHFNENGIMKMRPVQAIEISAGQSIELVPGGKHIMFFNVRKDALQEGQTVVLTLEFAKAGMIEVECLVKSVAGIAGKGIPVSFSPHASS